MKSYKMITKEEYIKNPVPIQFAGYYILKVQKYGLPEPDCFFVEDEEVPE